MYKIGLSSCGKELSRQLFADYAKAGLEAIEITPNWEDYKYLNYKDLKRYSEEFGVTLWSYHLPFQTTDLSTQDRAWRLCATEYMSELIKQGSDIGIHKFVAHPSSGSFPPEERAERILCAKDSLNELAEVAARFDSEICVEVLPRECLGNCSDELLDIISVNDKLKVCYDTNHLLKEDCITFLERVGHKIATVHVSDYDFVDERHWLPGEGKLDWTQLYNGLQKCGYNGIWMYEIRFERSDREKVLTCIDFAENAKEIFAGTVPTLRR